MLWQLSVGTCHFTVDLKEHILQSQRTAFGASRANGSACGQKCRFPRAFHVHVQRVVGQHIDTQKKFFGVFRPSGQPADTAQALGHGDVSPVSRFYPQKDAGFLSHHPSGCGTTSAWSLVFRISGHGGLFLPPADPFEPQGRNLPPVSRSAHPALQGKSIRVLLCRPSVHHPKVSFGHSALGYRQTCRATDRRLCPAPGQSYAQNDQHDRAADQRRV